MSVAFGIRQSSEGIGTTDADLRKILGYKWLNRGIIAGLSVTGNSALNYNVAAGMAVCSKGDSDGKSEAYFAGGTSPDVTANGGSYDRYDAVWITSHDITQGDSDNIVTLGVTQGTPAASPSFPSVPTYATVLAYMHVPAGATTMASATVADQGDFAIPYGSSLGVLLNKQYTSASDHSSTITIGSGNVSLPTDRILRISVTLTCSSTSGSRGSVYAQVYLDGTLIRTFEHVTQPTSACSGQYEDVWNVAAGKHTITVKVSPGIANFHTYGTGDANSWAGQKLVVFDEGVVV